MDKDYKQCTVHSRNKVPLTTEELDRNLMYMVPLHDECYGGGPKLRVYIDWANIKSYSTYRSFLRLFNGYFYESSY